MKEEQEDSNQAGEVVVEDNVGQDASSRPRSRANTKPKRKSVASSKKSRSKEEASKETKCMYHCARCRTLFHNSFGLTRHLKTGVCVGKVAGSCKQNHAHQPLKVVFDTFADAVDWIEAQELDQFFVIRNSRLNTRFYSCISAAAGKEKSNKRESEPFYVKKRKSVMRKHCDCGASFALRNMMVCFCPEDSPELLDTSLCHTARSCFMLYGCLTHDHELEANSKHFARLSSATKSYALHLLDQGLSVSEVARRCNEKQESIGSSRKVTSSMVCSLRGLAKKKKKEQLEEKRRQEGSDNIEYHMISEPSAVATVTEGASVEEVVITSDIQIQMVPSCATEISVSEFDSDVARTVRKLHQVTAFLESTQVPVADKWRCLDHLKPVLSTLVLPSVLRKEVKAKMVTEG